MPAEQHARSDDTADDGNDALEALLDALGSRLGETWKVEDAKSRLTRLMASCREGKVEVIGVRGDPVLMLSWRELARLTAARVDNARTWGEVFAPTEELPSIETPLALPIGRRRAPLRLDDGEAPSARPAA